MEASRERNGNMHPVILEIGKIIRRMVSESNTITKVINTRVSGSAIRDTDRALTGEMRVANCVVNTQEIGLRIKSTEEGHSSTRMAIVTMATGLTECRRARAE